MASPEDVRMSDSTDGRDQLAYCGFYCGDCLGRTGVIADAAERFRAVLDKYQFEKTAHAMFSDEMPEYDKLTDMVTFMAGLRCPAVCRDREGDSNCGAKRCCIEKGYFACYECDGFETCETLKKAQVGIHEEACMLNLRAICEMGLDTWLERGRRHTYWTLGGDDPVGRGGDDEGQGQAV
jgi:hypothetical protein